MSKEIRDNLDEIQRNKKESPPPPSIQTIPKQRDIKDLSDKELGRELSVIEALRVAMMELVKANPEILVKKVGEDNMKFMNKYLAFSETAARLSSEQQLRAWENK